VTPSGLPPAAAAVPWRAAEVTSVRTEAPDVHTLVLDVPGWPGHLAGQHAEIRLTADDGYTATRNYSIASGPEDDVVEVTVERLADGEVSPYLVDVVQPGDQLELRGPIGGHFVWRAEDGGPLLLVAGGSGVAPFRSMLRHREASGSDAPVRLVYSLRSPREVIYGPELDELGRRDGIQVVYTFTRLAPPGWAGYARRLDADLLAETAWPAQDLPLVYVCGPTDFVEAAAAGLLALGHDAERVRTERYGGTEG
jgi:ferredoxin-NADP reductase